jgi:hypothetical protein
MWIIDCFGAWAQMLPPLRLPLPISVSGETLGTLTRVLLCKREEERGGWSGVGLVAAQGREGREFGEYCSSKDGCGLYSPPTPQRA